MTHRTRLALVLAVGSMVPLTVLALGVRREMTTRLEEQASRRAEALVGVLHADLAAETLSLRARLETLAGGLAADNRFRLAVRAGPAGDRAWLLDWAGQAMATSGLAVLRVQDEDGRVLSSGHFRNEFDRLDPDLPQSLVAAAGGPALARLLAPDGEVLMLAGVDSFTVADRRYWLTGGLSFDAARAAALVPSDELAVTLVLEAPDRTLVSEPIVLPFHDGVAGAARGTAHLRVTPDPAPVAAARASVDRWFGRALGLTLLLAIGLAVLLASRVSRPLTALAEKTTQLDLEHLDVDFASDRNDEIGALGNLLAAMTRRLQTSMARLREAERRAATGDLARQINHDVKNGLAPIRHVLRHLTETAAREPGRLADVFNERRVTLESSVTYLEGLARNYARLAPALAHTPSDLSALLRSIAGVTESDLVTVDVRLAPDLPPVRADAVVLRRIVENLMTNAVDALEGRPGRVTLATALIGNGAEPRVRLAVSDTGRGMTRDELDRAFDDFHSTKASGTGLGLSVVRRLVTDLGGTLRVETAPGQGSTFTLEIPAA